MKWKTKEKKLIHYPKNGDKRTIKKFLLLPLSLEGITKWLCLVKIRQKYHYSPSKRIEGCSDLFGSPSYTDNLSGWYNISWKKRKIK